jgi:hypothetical protein
MVNFEFRLPLGWGLHDPEEFPRLAPSEAALGQDRAVIDIGPLAKADLLLGHSTSIMSALLVSESIGEWHGILAMITADLTDVVLPPFTLENPDAITDVRIFDDHRVMVDRVSGFPYGPGLEFVPILTRQYRWIEPVGAAVTFFTTTKGMFGVSGRDTFNKLARAMSFNSSAGR